MRCVISTRVTHLLTRERMATHVEVYEEWLRVLQEQPDLFVKMIMWNESWVHYFEPITRQGNAHCKSQSSLKKQKVRQHSAVKKIDFNR